jgi:tetratricopeptide (TPR) repeat protein
LFPLPFSQIANGDAEELTPSVLEAKQIELEAVKTAESGNLDGSLDMLTRAIEIAPNYASLYNNRAQVYRLKNDVEHALADIEKAIQLCNGHGKVAEQLFTQRAMIRRLHGQEEEAYADFQRAAELGGVYARQMCTQLNPYAKLCNQMLKEAFGKLKEGQ